MTAVFRRRRKGTDSGPDSGPDTTVPGGTSAHTGAPDADAGAGSAPGVDASTVDAGPVAVPAGGKTPRPDGPWDVTEVEDSARGRVDLGGMLVPGTAGTQLRIDLDKTTSRVVSATLVHQESTLQLQAFAAPRTTGVWDDIRSEIRTGITGQGGLTQETQGAFGTELHVRLPVRLPDGRPGAQPLRFLGVDGPRWFLRGVLSGPAAHDAARAEILEKIFRRVVVVRGGEAMSPREQIPLRLPVGAVAQQVAAAAAAAGGGSGAAPAGAATDAATDAPSAEPVGEAVAVPAVDPVTDAAVDPEPPTAEPPTTEPPTAERAAPTPEPEGGSDLR